MKITEQQYRTEVLCGSGSPGYCLDCDEITGTAEPDAQGYECPECERSTLMGAEVAFLQGHIEIDE